MTSPERMAAIVERAFEYIWWWTTFTCVACALWSLFHAPAHPLPELAAMLMAGWLSGCVTTKLIGKRP